MLKGSRDISPAVPTVSHHTTPETPPPVPANIKATALSSISAYIRPNGDRFSRPSSPTIIKSSTAKRAASPRMESSVFILAFVASSNRPFPPLGISCRAADRNLHPLYSCRYKIRTMKNTDPLQTRSPFLCQPHHTSLRPYYRTPARPKKDDDDREGNQKTQQQQQ